MAGLIPQSFIQDLLARTDIVQVIGERLQLKKAGKEYMALSPFTNERTPSFTVSPQKQFYHCFSSGKHGTAITFLMEYERLTFVEAVEDLARRAGLTVPREGGSAAPALVLDGPLDALAAAEQFFKAELKKNSAAIEYLKKRGVTGETAKRFGIGLAPDSWDALAKLFPNPRHALDAGLLIKKDGGGVYDRFRNRIMFPIRDDRRGRVIAFGGRTLGDDKAKYLNSPETPLFHKGRNLYGLYEARQESGAIPYLVVVEGYMDAVMLAQHGIKHVVATLGTATTREHLTLLFKSTQRVVFCFDGDRAGRDAGWRALEQALPAVDETHECRFMFLPQGHDPDTYVQEVGAAAFREAVDVAEPMFDFLLNELRSKSDKTAEGRAKLVAMARPYVAQMRQGALRSKIIDELTVLARWNRGDVETSVAAPPGNLRFQATATGESPLDADSARPVRRALQLLLNRPDLASRVPQTGLLAAADAPGIGLLMEALEFFREHSDATAGQLLEHWRDHEQAVAVNQLAATPVEIEEDAVESEFSEQINKLQNHAVQRAMAGRVNAILKTAEQRSLTAPELAEVQAINAQLSGRKGV